MRTSLQVGTTVTALFFWGHIALAQHEGHAPRDRGAERVTRDAPSVATLLKHSDESLRAIGRALEGSDPRLLGDPLRDFVGAMDAIEAYFDAAGGDPERTRKEATKAQRALERHAARLGDLSGRAPEDLKEGLSAALDACDRALDATAAAGEEAAQALAQGGGHHGSGRRGVGCGHH